MVSESPKPRAAAPAETSACASIWLMPSVADAAFLDAIIADLARRFGSPVFASHLTLAGDLGEPPQAYVALLDRLAGSGRCFSQPVEDIVLTEIYFRSFYAAFARSPDLDALKQVCVASVGGSLSGFTPHISFLYGPVAEPGKSDAAADLRKSLKGRAITFDRVAVTNSSDRTPVGAWRVHAARALRER